MKQIDKLLLKARNTVQGFLYAVGLVEYDAEVNAYIAEPLACSNRMMEGQQHHETEAGAVRALEDLFESAGVPVDDCIIFVLDYGQEA